MIFIDNIGDVNVSDYDTVLAIVRKLKDNPKNLQQVQDLSPTIELLNRYIALKENNNWNICAFNKVYVSVFLEQVSQSQNARKWLNDIYQMDALGQKVCLVCHCKKEELCHRSIIAGILKGLGANVISKNDYSRYYKMYKKLREINNE